MIMAYENPRFSISEKIINIVKKLNIVDSRYHTKLITSKYLQRFPEPLNDLSVCFSRLHNHGTAGLTVVQETVIGTLTH